MTYRTQSPPSLRVESLLSGAGIAALALLVSACSSKDESNDDAASQLAACEEMRRDNPNLVCAPEGVDEGGGFVGDGETAGPSGTPTTSGEVDTDNACADSNTYIGRSSPAALQLLVDTSCSMAQAPEQDFGGGMQGGDMGVIDGPSACPDDLDSIEPFSCSFGNDMGGMQGGGGSKWQITRDALVDALGDFGESTWLGLMFYPFPPDTPADQVFAGQQCECFPDVDFFIAQNTVPAAALTSNQSTLVVDALNDALVNGSTPTHAAYREAVQYLRAATFTGDKYVVLITDGEPTYGLTDDDGCFGVGTQRVDSSALIADVAVAASNGISTFVIGSPGSEGAREDLSRMAEEGGTARSGCSSAADSDLFCHLDMTTEPDFGAALAGALGQVVDQTQDPCSYDLPMPAGGQSIDRSRVNVSYTDASGAAVEVPRDPSLTDCNSGWQYSEDQNTILLCPDVCTAVMSSGNTDVDILVGCRETVIGSGAR